MPARTQLPHSWSIDGWPPTVFPNSVTKARYLVRVHRDDLMACGALARVGRDLIVMGAGFEKWMQRKAVRVPGYEIAPNRDLAANRGESAA